jgi:hypothetical protein
MPTILQQISTIYQTHRLYFNCAGVVLLFFLIFFDVIQTFMVNIFALDYLCYQTLELLMTDDPKINDLKMLLKKWAIYSSFLGFDIIISMILFVPVSWFYPFIKMMMCLWIIHNPDNSIVMYDNYVKPLYTRYRPFVVKFMSVCNAITHKFSLHINELSTDLYEIVKKNQRLNNIFNILSNGSLTVLLDVTNDDDTKNK